MVTHHRRTCSTASAPDACSWRAGSASSRSARSRRGTRRSSRGRRGRPRCPCWLALGLGTGSLQGATRHQRPLSDADALSLASPLTVLTYLRRSGSTSARWGASTRRRDTACAGSARRRRCRRTSGSCRSGGGSARRACSSAARTRSPMVELKGTVWLHRSLEPFSGLESPTHFCNKLLYILVLQKKDLKRSALLSEHKKKFGNI